VATGNMHTNLVNFGRMVFELCERLDRQTNAYIHMLITIIIYKA